MRLLEWALGFTQSMEMPEFAEGELWEIGCAFLLLVGWRQEIREGGIGIVNRMIGKEV